MQKLRRLPQLQFDNRLLQLPENYYSIVPTTPLPEPQLLAFNPDAAALIDLDPAEAQTPEFTETMAGNQPLPGGVNIATLYAGHQFGVFVPQLGDGRAILIGQVRNSRNELWELQLKGAGKTPYSRFGDGRAVLRSTIREYLCSEAMHGLGIPTTRALCIVGSPEPVRRETVETAAVLCRMAPSHLRFGHFEVFYYRQEFDKLAPLADHTIAEYFPQLGERPDRYAAWLTEVIERTARLMAQWQAAGFCHGVMNTDNMSVLGLTLDYGPFGFMDAFDSGHICNHTDEAGRYAYNQQPGVGHWNCSKLLQATLPLLHAEPEKAVEIAQEILERYGVIYVKENLANWRAKLGLRDEQETDAGLINDLLNILDRSKADFTNTFRGLAQARCDSDSPPAVRDHIADVAAFDAWLVNYRARLRQEQSDDGERSARMNQVNPKYVLRNHLAQIAIEKAQAGEFSEIETLRKLLSRPFDEQAGMERYAEPPPVSMQTIEVSCSS